MKLVGLIPARGGSKGIPHKNLAPCAGRPLLAYTAEAAMEAACLERVILSTDEESIAEAGRGMGLDVPFLRPAKLAADDTPMLAVLEHLLGWLDEANDPVDGLVLLQPTSPLRRAEHIDGAVELYKKMSPATVVSVVAVPHQFTPASLMEETDGLLVPWMEGEMVLRRQDKPHLWARNGPAVLIVRPDDVRQGRLYGDRVAGFEMDARNSMDVDTMEDLEAVERLILWEAGTMKEATS